MLENFLFLHDFIINTEFNFNKVGLKDIIKSYNFYHISQNVSPKEEKQIINQNIKESTILIIDQIEDPSQQTNERYLIIGFERTILLLDQYSISFINNLLSVNPNLLFCFLSNSKLCIEGNIEINKKRIIESDEKKFLEEISNFKQQFKLYNKSKRISKIWSFIIRCISAYLIKKSYLSNAKNHIFQLYLNSSPQIMDENEYIELRDIGSGGSFTCSLIYHIKKGELYVIKKPNGNQEAPKLIDREISNYSKMQHPNLPKFYGKIKDKNFIVIEFINGQTLKNISKIDLKINDILIIISNLMNVIGYFHKRGLIYRDLKPDNIMINENKTAILIDLDRLIKYDEDMDQTMEIGAAYAAPEIAMGSKFSYSSDIYSLGKIIEFIINETKSKIIMDKQTKEQIEEIIKKCTNENKENRPLISNLINEFKPNLNACEILLESYEKIVMENPKNSEELYKLGTFYYDGRFVKPNINKAIHYLTLAADLNHPMALFNLGDIYCKGKYVNQDINKSIHFHLLASNLNLVQSQFSLGYIYGEGKYITRDIKKAIYYYSLAANQNFPQAQYNLGCIYYEGKYVTRDINKAIYYFTLAANQNKREAQYSLGALLYEGKYITQNIQKAIKYLTLSANQNFPLAQLLIGIIYYGGIYVARDNKKAIYYLTLAANNNISDAQYRLGLIYYNGERVPQDINKGIHYLTLAVNQNDVNAQYNLGLIYYEGEYITQNVNKAIHYFTLAANQDYPPAQSILGTLYYEGICVNQDINKAFHYLDLASNGNDNNAQFLLGIIYFQGKYTNKDINKSINYLTQAANQNNSEAQLYLGLIYYTKEEIDKSIHFYKLAANQNYSKAQLSLGLIYSDGKYIKRDIYQAIHYLALASNCNNSEAQFRLGLIYYEDKYVTQNISISIHFFELAANQDHSGAQYYLGIIYYYGEFIKRDINKAIHYLSIVANKNDSKAQFILGLIYYDGKYVRIDIKKSIHYF